MKNQPHCIYSGTSLFQPHLGHAKVAGLVRWLDLRETSLSGDDEVPGDKEVPREDEVPQRGILSWNISGGMANPRNRLVPDSMIWLNWLV